MANRTWVGLAPLVAQVTDFLAFTIDPGDVLKITIGTKFISYTALTNVEEDAIAALLALAQASTYPEFTEITWSSPSATILRATANIPGVAFTAVASIVAGGTGAFGSSNTTANSGPNDWRCTDNWAEGVVPVAGDSVFIDNSATSILYGIDFTGGYYGTITFGEYWSGEVGLPESNPAGYDEYRPTFMKFSSGGTTTLTYRGSGARAKFDFNAPTLGATVSIYNSGQSNDTYRPIMLNGKIHRLRLYRGSVSVAELVGQSSDIGTSSGEIFTGYVTSAEADAKLKIGGYGTVTIASACSTNLTAGQVEVINTSLPTIVTLSGAATLTQYGGTGGQIVNNGGTVRWPSVGTLSSYIGGPSSTFIRGNGKQGMTLTACTLDKGATFNDELGTITFTNPILLRSCKINEVTLDLGYNRTLQVA